MSACRSVAAAICIIHVGGFSSVLRYTVHSLAESVHYTGSLVTHDISKHNIGEMNAAADDQHHILVNMDQPKCVHCSLVTSRLSSSSSDSALADLTTIITYLLPGVYFCVLGVRKV